MATPVSHEEASDRAGSEDTARAPVGADAQAAGPRLTSDQIWTGLAKASFAVVSYVTPTGEPRSSGVVYKTVGRRLYVAVAPDGWKAKHIAVSGRVAVTVPVRRGGLLSLVFPIPPATISFHGAAIVHRADSAEVGPVLTELASLLPAERRSSSVLIEVLPEGEFVTYGLGVSLRNMRIPAAARGRVPVS
jgi:hypothetical protein